MVGLTSRSLWKTEATTSQDDKTQKSESAIIAAGDTLQILLETLLIPLRITEEARDSKEKNRKVQGGYCMKKAKKHCFLYMKNHVF